LTFNFKIGDSAPKSHLSLSWSISSIASLPYTPADESVTKSFSCAFSEPGKYVISVRVRDGYNALGTFSKTLIVSPVTLQQDPDNKSLMNLVAGGTDKSDIISFQNRWSGVEAFVNGVSYGIFKPTGKIIAFGGRGDDVISADASVPFDIQFFGQAGDDTLAGGSGVNHLVGGSGSDQLMDPNA
jgi:Ca2+-binding RTX toxin-like protein